jgi:hypothetical protein
VLEDAEHLIAAWNERQAKRIEAIRCRYRLVSQMKRKRPPTEAASKFEVEESSAALNEQSLGSKHCRIKKELCPVSE